MGIVDPEIVERLTHVEIRLAGRDDTKSWPRAVDNDPIEPICAGEGESSIKLVFVEPIFLLEGLVGPADIETAGGISKSSGWAISTRAGLISTEAELSMVSAMVLKAIQQPE